MLLISNFTKLKEVVSILTIEMKPRVHQYQSKSSLRKVIPTAAILPVLQIAALPLVVTWYLLSIANTDGIHCRHRQKSSTAFSWAQLYKACKHKQIAEQSKKPCLAEIGYQSTCRKVKIVVAGAPLIFCLVKKFAEQYFLLNGFMKFVFSMATTATISCGSLVI